MSEQNHDPAAFAARSPSITACHLNVGGRRVEKYEAVWVEIELPLEPRQARDLHVLDFPLGGLASVYFAWDAMASGKSGQAVDVDPQTSFGRKVAQLTQEQLELCFVGPSNQVGRRLDCM